MATPPPPPALQWDPSSLAFLTPYLPPPDLSAASSSPSPPPSSPRPFITLTYASSLDARLAVLPGLQTHLSGPETKTLTHYLRSRHDGILIGAGTAVADDPGLNCRLAGAGGFGAAGQGTAWQPRPVVLDPRGRWAVSGSSRCVVEAGRGRGKAPWLVVFAGCGDEGARRVLEGCGGRVIEYPRPEGDGGGGGASEARFEWATLLGMLKREGLDSVMVEGGASVINSLLDARGTEDQAGGAFVDSVIVTIAPVYLGDKGPLVGPPRGADAGSDALVRLTDVKWQGMGADVVMCGRLSQQQRPE